MGAKSVLISQGSSEEKRSCAGEGKMWPSRLHPKGEPWESPASTPGSNYKVAEPQLACVKDTFIKEKHASSSLL